MKKPELLAPAGNLRNLRYALAYGADAVYAGFPRYSLRVRNNDFNKIENLAKGIEQTHNAGRLFFLANNVIPHNNKLKWFMRDMAEVMELSPDALIMADPGLIMMMKEKWPDAPIHLSVQANTMNYASVKFWYSVGIKRVILSRELSLDEVQEIRQNCPEMEIEVFVHGALCIAYSGRCLLSGYLNHRDANQGSCTNSCRWKYKLSETPGEQAPTEEISVERHPAADKTYYLEEGERPGEHMPIEEDENGTYIMNSKDLRAVEHIQRLIDIGVDSFKIEGRTKSHYYVSRVTQVYRKAIDDAFGGKDFDGSLLAQLENLSNRGYTDGFYQRHHSQDHQNYIQANSKSDRQQFVAEFTGVTDNNGLMELEVKNKFAVGDQMEIIHPDGNVHFQLQAIINKDGQEMMEVPGGGYRVKIPVPPRDYKNALLAKELSE